MAGKRGRGTKLKDARPISLTEEIIAKVARAVRFGAFYETLAAIAGVHRDTFRAWMRRGEAEYRRVSEKKGRRPLKKEELFLKLSVAIEEAEAVCELKSLECWHGAINGTLPEVKEKTVIIQRLNKEGILETVSSQTTREEKKQRNWNAAAVWLRTKKPERYGLDAKREVEKEDIEIELIGDLFDDD